MFSLAQITTAIYNDITIVMQHARASRNGARFRPVASIAKEPTMPLTFTVTEGVLEPGSEQTTVKRLCEAMLKWHGLTDHPVMTPNVIGSLHVLKQGETFAGLVPAPIAVVEWLVPGLTFGSREIQAGYIEEATNIVHEASGFRQPKDHIWIAVMHAVDGTWGINGQALTNTQLQQALAP
jgi:hypothetical protein